MPTLITDSKHKTAAHSIFNLDGTSLSMIQESTGFVAQRVLAMIVNLGCDIAQQGVASVEDINAAVRLGLGYPYGPIEWGDKLGADKILLILDRMSAISRDPRYRPSAWLRRRVQLKLPLVTTV
jgi:3-hydroxybutyryl-CoA dehydrogenase